MSSRQPSRVVFVGNIPYTKSEEQIREILGQVGRVVNFRMVYDKENGRSKGFGFAEYSDPDTAASAVRNLNDTEIDGRRIRVDYSNETSVPDDEDRDGFPTKRGNTGAHGGVNGAAFNNSPSSNQPGSNQLPPLPPGRDLPEGITCNDSISQTLQTLPPGQLIDFLRSIHEMARTDTERCVELLNQAPQLGYATLQVLLLLSLVSPDVIQTVLEPQNTAPVPVLRPSYQAPAAAPVPAAAGYSGAAYPAPGVPATPPTMIGGFAPPPAISPAAVAPVGPPPTIAPALDTAALMQAVLNLTEEEISQLPPAEQQQVRELRVQFAAAR